MKLNCLINGGEGDVGWRVRWVGVSLRRGGGRGEVECEVGWRVRLGGRWVEGELEWKVRSGGR